MHVPCALYGMLGQGLGTADRHLQVGFLSVRFRELVSTPRSRTASLKLATWKPQRVSKLLCNQRQHIPCMIGFHNENPDEH